MYIDPRHLAQLSMIVEAGSFQAAADRIGLSQPALSRNMRTLEHRIGAPVFDRSSRRAMPTDLGLRLAQNGLAIRVAEEQAGKYSERVSSGAAGQLRIGAPPIIAGQFLTSRICRFLIDRPDCKVDVRVGLVHELRTMLERAQIDLVIGPRDLADRVAESHFVPLADDRVGILCRADHDLLARETIQLTDLEQQHWVAHSRGSMLRQQTEGALIALGLERINITVETDSIQSVLEIVGSTDLISTMPRETTRPYLADRLTFLAFDHPQFHRPIGAIRRTSAPTNRAVDEFVNVLKSETPAIDPI
ncbi:MAG: LysR family transcriptional regulator [Alphaproteobacteria bacterium]|nr:LysR family transcriptional regulator [Alphaproteobacteria bacterium]